MKQSQVKRAPGRRSGHKDAQKPAPKKQPENKELRRMTIAAQDELLKWNAQKWGE